MSTLDKIHVGYVNFEYINPLKIWLYIHRNLDIIKFVKYKIQEIKAAVSILWSSWIFDKKHLGIGR